MVNRQQWGIGRGINHQIKIGRGIERDEGIDRKINTGSESRHGLSRLSLSRVWGKIRLLPDESISDEPFTFRADQVLSYLGSVLRTFSEK